MEDSKLHVIARHEMWNSKSVELKRKYNKILFFIYWKYLKCYKVLHLYKRKKDDGNKQKGFLFIIFII